MSVKIPRHIERRQARPGMDLYDYMLCLYADDMLILRRVEHEVRAETASYRDVQHLRISENLLRGRMRLNLTGGAFDLPYNTVSRDVMVRLTDIIREHYGRPGGPASATAIAKVDTDQLSFYFSGLLRAERASTSGMQLLAAQSNTAVATSETNALRRVLFGMASKTLLESMHLCDGRELKVVGRGGAFAYRWQSVYGHDVSYIPLSNLVRCAWQEDPRNDAVTNLVLRTSGGDSSWPFIRDNRSMEGYAAFLERLS